MRTSEVIRALVKLLKGERPSLSIEITYECPLRCPGCYAYNDDHLGGWVTLRNLSDRKGQDVRDGVFELVDRILYISPSWEAIRNRWKGASKCR